MTTKTSDPKDHYNSSLHNLVSKGIAYDNKVYEWIWTYIKNNLWQQMDKDWVKKVVFVLDDPLQEYDDDIVLIKKVLKSFLPTVKKSLKIDDTHLLKDRIKSPTRRVGLIDRLIKQQLNLYKETRDKSWLLTKVLQEWPEKHAITMMQPRKKELVGDKVPQTQKTIIANILTYMILEEELKKKESNKDIDDPNIIRHTLKI